MSNLHWRLMAFCSTLILGACSGGSGSQPQSTPIPEATSVNISGSVGDGPVTNAAIQIIDANGNEIGSTTSDALANYSFTLPANTVLPVEIRATGGLDLVTGRALDFDLVSIITNSTRTNVNISPLTTLEHEVSKCLPAGQSSEEAKQIVASNMPMGLGDTDPQSVTVNPSNAAAIVKANEALGEVVRRSAAILSDSDVTEVLAHIGCDLADGVLDGNGSSTTQIAGVVHANLAAVLVETLSNSLKVDGTDATQRMNDSVLTIQPEAELLTENVPPDTETVKLLQRSIRLLRTATGNTLLNELEEVIAANSLDQLPNALATELSPSTTQSLRELPMLTSQAPSEELSAIANAATLAHEAVEPKVTLTVNKNTIASGDSVDLTWSTTNADLCMAGGDWDGEQELSGATTVSSVTATSNFNLTCTGIGGLDTVNRRVIVQSITDTQQPTSPQPPEPPQEATPLAPLVTFGAANSSLLNGESTTLSWTATNAATCVANGDWSGNKSTSGSHNTGPLTSRATFGLACSGAGGESIHSINIAVAATQDVPLVAPEASVSLSAVQPWVPRSGTTTLTWSATGVTECRASGAWSGVKSLTGSESIGPITQDASYSLTCSSDDSNAVAITDVSIRQARLSWSAPTTNSEGTVLNNLAGYRAHWGTTRGQYENSRDIDAAETSHTIELVPGVYYFNLTSLNDDGEESDFAGERSKTIE